MQDHGNKMVEMKAVEEQRRVRNRPPEMFVSMAPINIQIAAMEHFVFVYFGFYLLLKCGLIEETLVAHRKCVD